MLLNSQRRRQTSHRDERIRYALAFTIIATSWCIQANAHPVAQGAIDVEVDQSALHVQATVSAEEVLVAATSSANNTARTGNPWRDYGEYLRRHLHVTADGKTLVGRVVSVTQSAAPRPVYVLEYDFRGSVSTERGVAYRPAIQARRIAGSRPTQVRIAQDTLHEIEYAPGNRWEAAYLVTLHRSPSATAAANTAPVGATVTGSAPTDIASVDATPARSIALAAASSGTSAVASATHLLTLTQPFEFDIATSKSAHSSSAGTHSLAFEFYLYGVRHILGGFDHLLFVGALVLAATGLWDLVKVISAFTLAHTLTLTLATLDIVRLPPAVVEPAIAISIVVVALQNLRDWKSRHPPSTRRASTRALVAFFFGLFHGLGFAGGLLDAAANMPTKQLITALAAFSVGVECGQQLVVIPVFLTLALFYKAGARTAHTTAVVHRIGSVAITLGGLGYLVAMLRY